MDCRHCGPTERDGGGRGLCTRCYAKPAVRALYPPLPRGAATAAQAAENAARRAAGEPTAAEIEALVAEQSKPENLPPWWDEESRKDRNRRARERDEEGDVT